MSTRQRRKLYGVRRQSRRPRDWTRWYREGVQMPVQSEGFGFVPRSGIHPAFDRVRSFQTVLVSPASGAWEAGTV